MGKRRMVRWVGHGRRGGFRRSLGACRGFVLVLGLSAFCPAATAEAQVGNAEAGAVFECPRKSCHVAPVTEAGGFVGKAANRSVKPTLAVTCRGSLIATTLEPDDRGGVGMAFNEDNGFACARGGKVEIHGLAGGGWYWIVERGRAVAAPLIAKAAIRNAVVAPWDPGSLDVDMIPMKDGYGTLVWDVRSDSLSILPHILPRAEAAPPLPCGPTRRGTTWVQVSKGCLLGDGGTAIALAHGGEFVPPGAGVARVTRPVAGELIVRLSLWGNGTGHISTATPPDPRHGHYVTGATPLAASSWSVRIAGSPGTTGAATLTGRVLTIAADEDYCNSRGQPPVDFPVTLTVTAAVGDPASVPVAPPVEVDDDSVAASRKIVIACPRAAASKGTDLLAASPENGPGRRRR